MKRIYQPAVNEGWEWALPTKESENRMIVDTFGQPLERNWTPIRMKLLTHDECGRPGRRPTCRGLANTF